MSAKRSTPLRNMHSPEKEMEAPNSLGDFGKSIVKDTTNSFQQLGTDLFEQILGFGGPKKEDRIDPEMLEQFRKSENAKPVQKNERITLFSLREQREAQQVREIRELLKQIKEEIKAIKRAESMMEAEIKGAERLTMENDPKAGVYHIRFLEIILKLLHSIRAKLGESNAWLSVMHSKKAKRGSAFAQRAKEKGTQYSMSMELSNARSAQ